MQEHIVLLTVRYEKKAPSSATRPVFVLVNSKKNQWSPIIAAVQPGELPVEAAVHAGEALFGEGSVSSIWLLGRVKEGQTTHYYCLDTDSLGVEQPEDIDHHTWVPLNDVIARYTDDARLLVEKMRAYEKT